MGKKKKKSKKARIEARQKLKNMTLGQMLEKGHQFFETGKARDAIDMFKLAIKQHGRSDEIDILLFRAYLLREGQLRKKGMNTEADIIKAQALIYIQDLKSLSENDMLAYVSTCTNDDAFNAYAEYLSANDQSPKIEQFLAYRLFEYDAWNLLEKINGSVSLKRDAIPVKTAVSLMNEAKWEDALDALRPISRTSPFAPIRLFCRAMVAFYKEDDEDMSRALSMVPDDFPLIPVVKSLEETVSGKPERDKTKASVSVCNCLWEGAIISENEVEKLIDILEKKRFSQVEHAICRLADKIYPQDPTTAKFFILQVIWNTVQQHTIFDYEYQKIVKNILPSEHADLLLAKTKYMSFYLPVTMTGQYLSLLENEFPDHECQKIAHSLILQHTVNMLNEKKAHMEEDKRKIQKYKSLLGITSEDPELMLIDMTTESIRLDPYNRKGYELLVELPCNSRAAKNAVESPLLYMKECFPDDPFPCLKLAALYYQKNAFRKAENILEEAMKRAPHDNRVLDQHALSLLISAEKNFNRDNFHLVIKDIEKAEKLERKKIAPFIIEKRMIFQIAIEQEDVKTVIKDGLDHLSPLDRLRILAILIIDIMYRRFDVKHKILKALEKIFNNRLKDAKELSSSEIVKLLRPLEKDYMSIIPSLKVAPIFLKNQKGMLKKVDDSEIISLYNSILEPDLFDLIKKDIKQRIKKAKKDQGVLLEFYLATLEHITGKVEGGRPFKNIIEKSSGPMMEELRGASRRLSKYASGTLKMALEKFDFDILDERFFDHDFFDHIYDEIIDEDFDEEDMFAGMDDKLGLNAFYYYLMDLEYLDTKSLQEEMDEMVSQVESFLDKSELRGAPDFILRQFRSLTRSEPSVCYQFDRLAKWIQQYRLPDISHDAMIFLYGKKLKKSMK